MKKQFQRVKQLADQTFLKADKSEALNHEELKNADQKVEFLRTTVSSIVKKLPNTTINDQEKKRKKGLEYHLASVFEDLTNRQDNGGFKEELFETILRKCNIAEKDLAEVCASYEKSIDTLVRQQLQQLLDNDFQNIAKQKSTLKKYILDKDFANNRYNNSTKKETLKDDMEEADMKVEQNRDALANEMFSLLAKESEMTVSMLQLLKCQKSYHEDAYKLLEKVIPEMELAIGNSSVRKVFGTDLEEHLRVTGKRIAYPLEICVQLLTKLGMREEGLFRIVGGSTRVKRLQSSIDSGCFSCQNPNPEYLEVHVLASVLKKYLRELPNPLLQFGLYHKWLEAMHHPEPKRLDEVKHLLTFLPLANRENLAYLIQFLAKIATYEENKMNTLNLAIVIAPTLLWNRDEITINMEHCGTINSLVELLIKNVEELFPDDVSNLVRITVKLNDSLYECSIALDEHNSSPVGSPSLAMPSSVISSVENLSHNGSPKPKNRKQKSTAPRVPIEIMHKSDDFISQKSPYTSYPSGSSTLTRSNKQKTTIGVNTEEKRFHETHTGETQTYHSPLDLVDHRVVTEPSTQIHVSVGKPVQAVTAQSALTEKNFKTTLIREVNSENKNQKPTAAPRSVSRNSSMKLDGDVLLRKPEVAHKPDIPVRPASLGKRSSVDLQKTQCSMTTVANKQQASYVNVQNRGEKFQPGHDNQIAEKEKFLGHAPSSVENQFDDVNSNSKPLLPPKFSRSSEKLDASKSNENLGDLRENGNQKPSHIRTRSDGNLIELSEHKAQTPPSPRGFVPKPNIPPPPPPVARKEPDSTDL